MLRRALPISLSASDAKDAIDHASDFASAFIARSTPEDYRFRYLGRLSVKDLYEYDDVGAWIDVAPGETKGATMEERVAMLKTVRGSAWAARALAWLTLGIPPIVIISVPGNEGGTFTTIGDGRGRTNFAAIMGKRLPVWHMTYVGRSTSRKPL